MASVKKELTNVKEWKFGKDGLIPVVAQDYESGEVLMLAYMNEDAAEKTFQSVSFSASKNAAITAWVLPTPSPCFTTCFFARS